jgi:hypothetical protein
MYKILVVLTFIFSFLLITPFTADLIKEQFVTGDIGTAYWLETWECRISILVNSGLIWIFLIRVIIYNVVFATFVTSLLFLYRHFSKE